MDDLTFLADPRFDLCRGQQIFYAEERRAHLCAELETFDRDVVLQTLAGLLTQPQFHANTVRLELLAHLAVLRCKGSRRPEAADWHKWLNDEMRSGFGALEDPPEDVFIGNVMSWNGNSRLFEGAWEANAAYVQSCLFAIAQCAAAGERWAEHCGRQAGALLTLSDALAARAGLERYAQGGGDRIGTLDLSQALLDEAAKRSRFDNADLAELGIATFNLQPFDFSRVPPGILRHEQIHWTSLEERPLLIDEQGVTICLPAAMGSAIRRRALDMAVRNEAADLFDGFVLEHQWRSVERALAGLGLQLLRAPDVDPAQAIVQAECRFDEGAYAHVMLIGDRCSELAAGGFHSYRDSMALTAELTEAASARLAASDDYRHGLTIAVFGGLGRPLPAAVNELPADWRLLGLNYEDLVLISAERNNSAIRMARLLREADELAERGCAIHNNNGFMNLYGFAVEMDHELVVPDATCHNSLIGIGPSSVATIRTRLRRALDPHAALLPGNRAFAEVERPSSEAYFTELMEAPSFISITHAMRGELAGLVEQGPRTWWVRIEDNADGQTGALSARAWDCAQNWLLRIAPMLEAGLPRLPLGAIDIRLCFPDIAGFDRQIEIGRLSEPEVTGSEAAISIRCDCAFLNAFRRPDNLGDRWMVAAIARGAAMLGEEEPEAFAERIVSAAITDDRARFLHLLPAHTGADALLASLDIPAARTVEPDVRAWLELGIAQAAGADQDAFGLLFGRDATELLGNAVERLWERCRARLVTLDRQDVIERCLANQNAIDRDRASWRNTAAALFQLHDRAVVHETNTKRESALADASLASRVVAEMALCTSPLEGGRPCSTDDFDRLTAAVSLLTHLASRSDEIHYGFADRIEVLRNGSLRFLDDFAEIIHRPFLTTMQKDRYEAAAESYSERFDEPEELTDEDYEKAAIPAFDQAFKAEYGLIPLHLADVVNAITVKALEQHEHVLTIRRSELLEIASGIPGVTDADAARLLDAWTLRPRERWNEDHPQGAHKRDWYPWRYARRLSLVARPIVQLSNDDDALCLVSPIMVDHALHFAVSSYSARIPDSFFRTAEMRAWIGGAIDRIGHAFNQRVRERLVELGLEAEAECQMTQLGGTTGNGDVDVLAWDSTSGAVYVLECKRLRADLTPGEIAERLREFDPDYRPKGSKRGPTRKHLDRLEILSSKLDVLAKRTGIPAERIQLMSCLVTAKLVPMQFQQEASAHFNLIASFDQLATAFQRPA